jgi:predicted lipid-binding transport protein (Tim44 family)
MELGESVLTFLVVMAIVLWNAGEALKDLQSRQQADKTLASPVESEASDNAASLAWARPADSAVGTNVSPAIADQLDSIGLADLTFDRAGFLCSVGMVYETVVADFARGDRELLHDLLSDDVYETFLGIIDDRAMRGERVELSIVRVNRVAIVDAHVFNGRMQITVNIESELVNATRDLTGTVIAGDPVRIVGASDNWTFAKELASRNPAWKLAATEAAPPDSAPSSDANSPLPGPARRREAALAGEAAAQ